MAVRFSIRTNPSDENDIDISIVEIADAIAEAIPKMFPGLFISITSEAAIEVEKFPTGSFFYISRSALKENR